MFSQYLLATCLGSYLPLPADLLGVGLGVQCSGCFHGSWGMSENMIFNLVSNYNSLKLPVRVPGTCQLWRCCGNHTSSSTNLVCSCPYHQSSDQARHTTDSPRFVSCRCLAIGGWTDRFCSSCLCYRFVELRRWWLFHFLFLCSSCLVCGIRRLSSFLQLKVKHIDSQTSYLNHLLTVNRPIYNVRIWKPNLDRMIFVLKPNDYIVFTHGTSSRTLPVWTRSPVGWCGMRTICCRSHEGLLGMWKVLLFLVPSCFYLLN